MLDCSQREIRARLFEGRFGMEKEGLRVTRTGHMAHTLHPFLNEEIVTDFAENQTEINTPVCDTLDEMLACVRDLMIMMQSVLAFRQELLWPFSSPCALHGEDDIPIASMAVSEEGRKYREYLAGRYGRYRMTFCGIHFNYSFGEQLLEAQWQLDGSPKEYQAWKDRFYLRIAQRIAGAGWLLAVLFNASPLVDGSYFDRHHDGQTCFTGMASVRNSEMGYWNFFAPVFDYRDMESYTRSIESYCRRSLLKAPRELYYPVRIKPAGSYSMENLRSQGADHLELRMIDLNPYELCGISRKDARFLHLFLVYLACLDKPDLSEEEQVLAAQNIKNASRYDLKISRIADDQSQSKTIWQAAMDFLDAIQAFAEEYAPDYLDALEAQRAKLTDPQNCRLAWKVREDFSDGFLEKGLALAAERQRQALAAWEMQDGAGSEEMFASGAAGLTA